VRRYLAAMRSTLAPLATLLLVAACGGGSSRPVRAVPAISSLRGGPVHCLEELPARGHCTQGQRAVVEPKERSSCGRSNDPANEYFLMWVGEPVGNTEVWRCIGLPTTY
jgi:hypothetical protein